ncbi:MAG: nitrogen fixation protein NifH [Anaerolineae bacterium]|nr:nitrogen fixation protein NifH [Anaerolineae bacterium]
MSWRDQLNGDPFPWLLEHGDPGVRYLALRDLLDLSSSDSTLLRARESAYTEGPISVILSHQHADGYWEKPGPGYSPKYRSTVWSVITLAQLGASVDGDPRIGRACAYIFEHAFSAGGQFSATGAPSGTADCLQGNLCGSMLDLGCQDPRLETAVDWIASTVTGEGIAPATERKAARRYYAGKCGPTFCCGSNNRLSCAWGAAKVMLALGKLPVERRTPAMDVAIEHGVDFLFSIDPAEATYPSGYAESPSRNWWKFGFPVFYVTDILQIVEALAALGYSQDPRLKNALELVRAKQDDRGRWSLEYDYTGKTWVDFGERKQPSKWVTLRALKVLKLVSDGV